MSHSSQNLLSRADVEAVISLLFEGDVYPDRRSVLLASLPRNVRGQLERVRRPLDQLRLDIERLNEPGWECEEGPALATMIETAIQLLKPRTEAQELKQYLDRLRQGRSRSDGYTDWSPEPMEAVRCSPDERVFLVWHRKGNTYSTSWFTVDGGRIHPRSAPAPFLLLATADRLWRGDAVPIHQWLVPGAGFDRVGPEILEPTYGYRLLDLRSGATLPASAIGWGNPRRPRRKTDSTASLEYDREDRIVGAIGHLCLYRSSVYDWRGQNCGHSAIEFRVMDLADGARWSAWDDFKARAVQDAELVGRAQDAWWDDDTDRGRPDHREALEFELTEIRLRFSTDGLLTFACQFSAEASCHAYSDGSAGCFRRSVWVETERLPEALEPYRHIPDPVRVWYERNMNGFLGWTALPNTEETRQALEHLLRRPPV